MRCNQIPIYECLTSCPETQCYARDLRIAVQNTDRENLVELALEDYWRSAYETAVDDTLYQVYDGELEGLEKLNG